jgi:quercetin dioxygenase-like cupin family protein
MNSAQKQHNKKALTVGEGFVEPPGEVHNLRNASTTAPAKGIGFQVAPRGTPLQTNVPQAHGKILE